MNRILLLVSFRWLMGTDVPDMLGTKIAFSLHLKQFLEKGAIQHLASWWVL